MPPATMRVAFFVNRKKLYSLFKNNHSKVRALLVKEWYDRQWKRKQIYKEVDRL